MPRGDVTVRAEKAPSRVVLTISMDDAEGTFKLAPLQAAWLAGQLHRAIIETIEPETRGVPAEAHEGFDFWTCNLYDAFHQWQRTPVSTVRGIALMIAEATADGTPWSLSMPMLRDPLDPPGNPEKEPK